MNLKRMRFLPGLAPPEKITFKRSLWQSGVCHLGGRTCLPPLKQGCPACFQSRLLRMTPTFIRYRCAELSFASPVTISPEKHSEPSKPTLVGRQQISATSPAGGSGNSTNSSNRISQLGPQRPRGGPVVANHRQHTDERVAPSTLAENSSFASVPRSTR